MELLISSFGSDAKRHGGTRRSAQIQELLLQNESKTIVPPSGKRAILSFAFRHPFSILAMLPVALLVSYRYLGLRGLIGAILYGGWLHSELRQFNWTTIRIEITPNINLILANMLASLGLKYISYPHNIEFLVPGQSQSFFRSGSAAFAAEVNVYKKSSSVFTISDFDSAVIKSLGVSRVETLYYKPARIDAIAIAEIKKLRACSVGGFFLILGTAENHPTRIGFENILGDIKLSNDFTKRFVLAGFGTERLRDCAPDQVTVLGAVSATSLKQLLADCDGLIIYQPQTSGFLTRLTEAIDAEVPVYVFEGYLQARILNHPSVYLISSIKDLPSNKFVN
jgi:hypothetical protein